MGGRGSSGGAAGSGTKYAYGSQMGARTRDAENAYNEYAVERGLTSALQMSGKAYEVKSDIDSTLASKGPKATYEEMSNKIMKSFKSGNITKTEAGILQVYNNNIVYGEL